jgi:anaerobic selenocysteine-containing dehydrogenase
VEISETDAEKLGIHEGELVEVRSRRGHVVVPARISGIEPGVAFIPFHYGDDGTDDAPTEANRLTMSGWDAVSKQPFFKYAAVSILPVRADEEPPRNGRRSPVTGRRTPRPRIERRTPVGSGKIGR